MSRLKIYLQKLRSFTKEPHVKVGALIFLITLLSFGVGYLAGRDWTPAPIVIEKVENSK